MMNRAVQGLHASFPLSWDTRALLFSCREQTQRIANSVSNKMEASDDNKQAAPSNQREPICIDHGRPLVRPPKSDERQPATGAIAPATYSWLGYINSPCWLYPPSSVPPCPLPSASLPHLEPGSRPRYHGVRWRARRLSKHYGEGEGKHSLARRSPSCLRRAVADASICAGELHSITLSCSPLT